MLRLVLLSALLLMAASAHAQTADPEWQTPVIDGFGRSVHLADSAVKPDAQLGYKLVVDVTKAPSDPATPSPGLDHLARVFNTFSLYGVEPSAIRAVAVLHGPATTAALADAAYRERHDGTPNPNLDLIRQLAAHGVEVYVCGTALAENGIAESAVGPDVEIATSALTVLATYQIMGYALLPY